MFQVPDEYRQKVAWIESRNNPNAKNPNSSAKGKYQFIDSTAKAYGLADPFDEKEADKAFDQFTADNYNILKTSLKREPTQGELYLAHQQGAGGALKLLRNPNAKAADVVGRDAIKLNGGKDDMTASDFAQKWTSKLDEPKLNNNAQAIADGMANQRQQPIEQTADAGNVQTDAPKFDKMTLFLEAEKRGLLPADKLELLAEARKRGLIPGGEVKQEPGFVDRVTDRASERGQQLQVIDSETAAGNQTGFESALQKTGNAAGLLNDVVGEGFKSIGSGISSIVPDAIENPVKEAGRNVLNYAANTGIGRTFTGAVDEVQAAYNQLEKDSPRSARNVNALGNIGLLATAARPVKGATVATTDLAKQGAEAVKAVPKAASNALESLSQQGRNLKERISPQVSDIVTSDEARKMASPLFKEAENLGGVLGAETTDKFISRVGGIAPKTSSKVEGGGGVVKKYLDDLVEEKAGQPLTLEAIKNMDEHLSDLITEEIKATGKITNKGRQLSEVQDALREITDEAAATDTVGKSAEAFDAWRRGQSVWADSYKLKDIEDIFERAALTDNEAQSIKTQFRNLYMNKKKLNKYSQEHQKMIKKAAEQNLKVDALRVIGSRLISTGVGFGTGGAAGAMAAYPIAAGARKGAAALQAAPGKKILKEISTKVKETSNPLYDISKRNNAE